MKEGCDMGTRQEFTIRRVDGKWERTIIGRTGLKHVDEGHVGEKGKNGHFTNEGEYHRAIENAVKENSQ